MIKNFFFPKNQDIEVKKPEKIALFFGTNNGKLMNYLFFIKKYISIYYYIDREITEDLVFFRIKEEVDKMNHGDFLFLYFGSGKSIHKNIIPFFRMLRKRIHIFILIENYKKNFFPVPYVLKYPHERIRIRNNELFLPLIISIYSSERGILKVFEESLKEFHSNHIYIRMLLLKIQDKFIDMKKKDEILPEICISSFDCWSCEL